MNRKQPTPTPVERLMAAMDRCAIARGEAQWTHGYRTRLSTEGKVGESDEARLYEREKKQWTRVDTAESNFRRLAARLLREARRAK